MRNYIIGLFMIASVCTMYAQTMDSKLQMSLEETKAKFVEFDTEHLLDSLDQEKLPRLVSGGVFIGGNISNFIITRSHQSMSSHMRVGGELGGFLDFNLTKHFVIEPQVIFTAHQNHFKEQNDTTNHLWSFGAEIPIYFMGRFGNMEKGYIQFGGGIFTHFTYLSNVNKKFQNIDESVATSVTSTSSGTSATDGYDYSELYKLHNNHFGLCAQVGYETPFGMTIFAVYKVSLSDIAGFYKEKKGDPIADALIYPQSVSLNIGYHWR